MQDEVKDMRRNQAPEALRHAQSRHEHSGLTDEQWAAFLLDYTGQVDDNLSAYVKWVDAELAKLKGTPPQPGDPHTPYLPADTELNTLTTAVMLDELPGRERLVHAQQDA